MVIFSRIKDKDEVRNDIKLINQYILIIYDKNTLKNRFKRSLLIAVHAPGNVSTHAKLNVPIIPRII